MILLTGFYEDGNVARQGEFLECIRRNVANERIEALYLFIEEPCGTDRLLATYPPLAARKVQPIALGRRLTYRDLFDYANQQLVGQRVIIANADIYFDQTLAELDGYELSGKLLCLSRWDVQADGSACHFDHPASQDVWIFQAPLRELACDFPLGVLGCDNRLAWEAERVGLVLSNPSRSLRAYHLHLSQVRRYSDQSRLAGPTRSVPTTFLDRRDRRGTIFALTSLPPAPQHVPHTQACIRSWREAGLTVRAFNHPAEIRRLAGCYDVDFVPVTETTAEVFGRYYIPINAMLDWAHQQDVSALLLNADLLLRMADWEMKRVRWITEGGLCYFIRYNHEGTIAQAQREPYGIDAFLFHGRDAAHFPASFLSMGQPFWDYWLPYTFAARNRPIYTIEFPAAFHRTHPSAWSWADWHRCALEFTRVTGQAGDNESFEACVAMSLRVRHTFDQHRVSLAQQPPSIQTWVQQRFRDPGPKLFLELGAHRGTDTAWLAELPDVTIHAFEPDPRNHQPPRPNVVLHRAAIADRDGGGSLHLSERGWGQEWTHSSSIKRPKNHLHRYPVTFGGMVEVELVALDTFYQQQGLDVIDFIWADIQGAEGEMIRGGRRALSRTRYLYTEYSDDEMYDGQITLSEILDLLPEFRVLELWPDDVLLENRALTP